MTPSAETDRASAEEARRAELAALLVRAQGGERAALDAIVDMLMPLVWNVARAGGADRELAADVVQNVWLVFLQHVGDIKNPAALASWLITVTRREVARVRVSARRDVLVDQETLTERADPLVEVAAYVAEHENHRVLWQNLRLLSERCQELLRIVAFADRPNYRGIADKLRMPLGSIGPTRGRCLAELRRLLAKDPNWSMQ